MGLDRTETSVYRRQTVPQAEAQDSASWLRIWHEQLSYTPTNLHFHEVLCHLELWAKINASSLSCFCQLFCNEINYLVQVMECKDIALKSKTCLVWTQYPSPHKKNNDRETEWNQVSMKSAPVGIGGEDQIKLIKDTYETELKRKFTITLLSR